LKVIIDPNWSFIEALNAARKAYVGWGITSTGYRNSVMMAWGNLVGKKQAISELDTLIKQAGGKAKFAKSIDLGISSLRKISKYFEGLPDDFEIVNNDISYSFIEGKKVDFEEDIKHEFKEIKGNSPIKSAQNIVVEYAIGFLNGSGGSVFWGITDDALVKSVTLNAQNKDKFRLAINNKLQSIEPKLDPTLISVLFHSVEQKTDSYVIELLVPKSNSKGLYFNQSGDSWVKINGANQKLKGTALQDFIIRRLQKNN